MPLDSDPKKMLKKHDKLVHSENRKVVSHVQREKGEWIINTLMIDGVDVPFRYKRQKRYKSLVGARVNLTYYAATESVAGMDVEIMRVTRVRVA